MGEEIRESGVERLGVVAAVLGNRAEWREKSGIGGLWVGVLGLEGLGFRGRAGMEGESGGVSGVEGQGCGGGSLGLGESGVGGSLGLGSRIGMGRRGLAPKGGVQRWRAGRAWSSKGRVGLGLHGSGLESQRGG